MGVPRLEKCCCFFDLKTGNIILGFINAIMSFILFITMIVTSVELSTLEDDTARQMEILKDVEAIELDARLSGLYAMSIILVFMFLAKFLFDLFFIYGVFMERPGIIKAYYIMWTVFTLLSMFTFFLNSYFYGVGTILTEVVYIGINVYIILVSYSFYVQLNMREVV